MFDFNKCKFDFFFLYICLKRMCIKFIIFGFRMKNFVSKYYYLKFLKNLIKYAK